MWDVKVIPTSSRDNTGLLDWFLCVYDGTVGGSIRISLSQTHLPEIARKGVPVPLYDRAGLAPRIVHIGVGGFHRAHFAAYTHELAAAGGDWGIVGLGLLPAD